MIQSLTFGSGQQPQSPDFSLQHVEPSGHSEEPSGQITLSTCPVTAISVGRTEAFCFGAMLKMLLVPSHFDSATLHFEFSGQQWISSEQHTAYQRNTQ